MPAFKGHQGNMPSDLLSTVTDAMGSMLSTAQDMAARFGPGRGADDTSATAGTAPTWPTVTQVVDQVFTKFDTDKNSSISLAEIQAVIDPSGKATLLDTAIKSLVTQIDTNADGSLSKAEVTAAVTKLDTNGDGTLQPSDHAGTGPFASGTIDLMGLLHGHGMPGHPGGGDTTPPTPPTVAQIVDEIFSTFDGNANGSVTLAELMAVLDPKGTHTHLDDALKSVVTLVDTDKDGGMSKAEVTAAVKLLDADGNGTLDHADHIPGPPDDGSIDLIGLLMPHLHDFQGGGPGHGG